LVGPNVKVFGEEGLTKERVYEFELEGGKRVRGMGIRKGEVVVICGGGFHGKSTLMKAIGEGCWDHMPGGEFWGRDVSSFVRFSVRELDLANLLFPSFFYGASFGQTGESP